MKKLKREVRLKVILANKSAYPFFPFGGIEKYIYYLGKHLLRQGIDVEIVASLPADGKKSGIHDDIQYTFVSPYVGWKLPYSSLSVVRLALFSFNLASYLRKQSFDILHSFLTVPYFYLRLSKRRPVVFQPFEEIYEYKAFLEKRKDVIWAAKTNLIRHIKRGVDDYCMKRAEAIASEGEFQTAVFSKLFGTDRRKVFNLPVGIDVESIDKTLKERKLSRQDLGLDSGDLVLISVNRLEPSKGISCLIDAFRLVKERVQNARLILIGTGSEEEKIRSQIRDYRLEESITHLKNVQEDLLFNYYALSSIYVSPTFDTGSVMSIVEGMACGLPIVSTGQDFAVKSGINGFVVSRGNPEMIAQAVLSIHEGAKCKEFGAMSRKIVQEYDFGAIAKAAIKRYEELLRGYL